jgi:hypothetical protein
MKNLKVGYIDKLHVALFLSAPLRSGNPNLQAQGGIFTHTTVAPSASRALLSADEIIRAMADTNAWPRPVMYRFLLPQREAGRLLWLLSFDPVSGGTLFPGLGGVVRDVRDRARLGRKG